MEYSALKNEIEQCAKAHKLGKVTSVRTEKTIEGYVTAFFDTEKEKGLIFYKLINK